MENCDNYMNIITRIKNWWEDLWYETVLTPTGECFMMYLDEQVKGSDNYIETYEEAIEQIKEVAEKELECKFTRKEVIEFLNTYFQEKYGNSL